MNKQLNPARNTGESFEQYKRRRVANARTIKAYLRMGRPAEGYVAGPHKTHKPHKVKQEGTVMSAAGVPTPHTWVVMPPGTLVRA